MWGQEGRKSREGAKQGGKEGERGKANIKMLATKESGRRIYKGSLHDSYKLSTNKSLKLG